MKLMMLTMRGLSWAVLSAAWQPVKRAAMRANGKIREISML
jgi:hypothetical protein